jgi:hypothetical protein
VAQLADVQKRPERVDVRGRPDFLDLAHRLASAVSASCVRFFSSTRRAFAVARRTDTAAGPATPETPGGVVSKKAAMELRAAVNRVREAQCAAGVFPARVPW